MTTAKGSQARPYGLRESWQAGETAWFEYHLQVTVAGPLQADPAAAGMSYDERREEGLTGVYPVLFADGHEGHAWEDELLTGPEHFERPAPAAGAGGPTSRG